MGFFTFISGRDRRRHAHDRIAVERYEELLRQASPAEVARVHAEAFAKLSEGQRDMMFDQLVTGPIDRRPRRQHPSDVQSNRYAHLVASAASALAAPFFWPGFFDPGTTRSSEHGGR